MGTSPSNYIQVPSPPLGSIFKSPHRKTVFYLLRPQSFSFQIVFIDTFVKFSDFMSRGDGAFDSLFCPEGRVFVHSDCPRGMGLLTPCFVPRGGFLYTMIVPGEGFCSLRVMFQEGTVLDEIDSCIICTLSSCATEYCFCESYNRRQKNYFKRHG